MFLLTKMHGVNGGESESQNSKKNLKTIKRNLRNAKKREQTSYGRDEDKAAGVGNLARPVCATKKRERERKKTLVSVTIGCDLDQKQHTNIHT